MERIIFNVLPREGIKSYDGPSFVVLANNLHECEEILIEEMKKGNNDELVKFYFSKLEISKILEVKTNSDPQIILSIL